MKKISILILLVFVAFSCNKSKESKKVEKKEGKDVKKIELKKQDLKVLKLGKKIELKKETHIKELLENPKKYLDKKVLIKGTITKVCTRRGCWMNLIEEQSQIRAKVNDGVIVFPVESIGKLAKVEGILYALGEGDHHHHEKGEHKDCESTKDKKQEGCEGKKEDECEVKKDTKVIYQIKALGAEIQE